MAKFKLDLKTLIVLGIAALILFGTPQSFLGALSGVSLATYDDGGNRWLANVVINESYESISFLQSGATSGDAKAESSISLTFRQLDPSCSYQLFARTKSINMPFYSIPVVTYYELGNPVKNVPYNLSVVKNGKTDDYGKIDVGALGQTTVKLAGDQVKIHNLGQLSGGIECPGGAALMPVYNSSSQFAGYRVVSESSLRDYLDKIETAVLTLNIVLLNAALQQPPAVAPEFINYVSSIEQIPTGTDSFVVKLPKTSGYAEVLIEVDSAYADTVIYSPPNPKPRVTVALSTSNIDKTEHLTVKATVKNEGTAGTIQVFPTTTSGVFSFTPPSNQDEFKEGETKTFEFMAYGLKAGADSICVRAVGVQSGEQARNCAGAVVNEIQQYVPPVFPQDIETPEPESVEEQVSQVTPPNPDPIPVPDPSFNCEILPYDGIWVIGYVDKHISIPQYLFGFIPIQTGTVEETECAPVYNLTLLGSAVGITGIIVVGLVIYGVKKPKKKKRRRK